MYYFVSVVLCFFVTRLSGLLICILWSFFLFCFFCCFVLNLVFFCFFIPPKKRPPKKPDTAKTQKSKNAEKPDKKKVSAIVFTNSVLKFFGVGLKISFFAESTIKIVVSASFQTGKNTPKLAKMLSQNLVQGCVKTWSKYVAQQNWTKFWLKKSVIFSLFFCSFFFKISFSLQKVEDFWKTKKEKKEKPWTKFWLKKGYFWTKFWLYSIYIYIYMRAVESKICPRFAFLSQKSVQFLLFFLFFKDILLSAGKRDFFGRANKTKKPCLWVENLSNYVAQHTWTDFWLNLAQMFDSTFFTCLAHFPFSKYAETTVFIWFSAKMQFCSPPRKIGNTMCEHSRANWILFVLFFCIFAFLCFCCVRFLVVFGEEWKTKKTKFKTKQQRRKDNHKMQTTKPLGPVFQTRKTRQHRHKTIQIKCLKWKQKHKKNN